LAFERIGVPQGQVHVVPHGVDTTFFRPDDESRDTSRKRLGLANDQVVYLNVGAMTDNKGIGLLLQAFDGVVQRFPSARLILKGADAVYASKDLVRARIEALPSAAADRVGSRVIYLGKTMSMPDMGALLRVADAYVSPYLAEAFNLPVLEAAACGVPVICTEGGPTDEFTDDSFASRIRSRPVKVRMPDGQLGDALMPDVDHLAELMVSVALDPVSARGKGRTASRYVNSRFTWDAVTQVLLRELM
jgi:glycosyltransferase involved in cell wall biosynthesis